MEYCRGAALRHNQNPQDEPLIVDVYPGGVTCLMEDGETKSLTDEELKNYQIMDIFPEEDVQDMMK